MEKKMKAQEKREREEKIMFLAQVHNKTVFRF
jgi:hypothetical protein